LPGAQHSCALLSGGTVRCWGYNGNGELGIGTTTGPNNTPAAAVSGLSGVTAISSGDHDHTCALLSGGTVECWGYNGYGELGTNTTTSSSTPVAVSGLSGIVAIGARAYHSCAVSSSRAVQCWGDNSNGELGNGTTTNSSTPVQASAVAGAVAVHGGIRYTCALLSTGPVECWGLNTSGQLGNGTTTNSSIAVQAMNLAQGSPQLNGYVSLLAASSAPVLGRVDPSTNLALDIGLTAQSGLKDFVQQVSGPNSPTFRQYVLDVPTFGSRFGATSKDYQDTINWATAAGLTVTKFPNNLLIMVTGTATQFEQALFTNLYWRQRPDGTTTESATSTIPTSPWTSTWWRYSIIVSRPSPGRV
jgi:hypothetical protein